MGRTTPESKQCGVKYFTVEKNMVADPETALKRFGYLDSF